MDKQKLIECIESGMSIAQISKLENLSKSTIRYWLGKYELKTKNKSFKDGYVVNPILRIDGVPVQFCSKCKISLSEDTGYWREDKQSWMSNCKNCHNKYSVERWIKRKKDAIDYRGGECVNCGYNKFYGALEFHHLDPNLKDMDWSKLRLHPWDFIINELDKCICLCSNCHREIHQKHR